MRAAIYIRVSTSDGRQTTEEQLKQLRDACQCWGYEVVEVYEDHKSGGKGRKGRPEFDRMLKDSASKRFDIVVFWALDRFTREGINKSIKYLSILEQNKVGFRSLQEPFLNAENELVRHILVGCMSYMAKQERLRRSERAKMGAARAKANGQEFGHYGKKVLSKQNAEAANDFARQLSPTIERIRARGHRTISAISEELNRLGVDTPSGSGRWHISTTHKYLKRIEALA